MSIRSRRSTPATTRSRRRSRDSRPSIVAASASARSSSSRSTSRSRSARSKRRSRSRPIRRSSKRRTRRRRSPRQPRCSRHCRPSAATCSSWPSRCRPCRAAATRTGTGCRIRPAPRRSRSAAAACGRTTTCSTASRSPTCRTAPRPIPAAKRSKTCSVQVHTYDAEMGRTGGGVFNTTAKSGSNVFRGSGFFQIRPNPLIGALFFNQIRGIENQPQFWRDCRRRLRRPDRQGQDVLLGRRRRVPRRTVAERQHARADRGGAQRRFLAPDRRAGPAGHHLRPVDDRRQRQPAAVPGQHHSRRTASTRSALQILKPLPLPNDGGRRQRRRQLLPAQDVIKDEAQQASVKIDHHFSDNIALSGVYLCQNSHEPDNNFFPDARYAAAELSARSRHQRVRVQQHLHRESVDRVDAALRV